MLSQRNKAAGTIVIALVFVNLRYKHIQSVNLSGLFPFFLEDS